MVHIYAASRSIVNPYLFVIDIYEKAINFYHIYIDIYEIRSKSGCQ
jgi:hypothetical protein